MDLFYQFEIIESIGHSSIEIVPYIRNPTNEKRMEFFTAFRSLVQNFNLARINSYPGLNHVYVIWINCSLVWGNLNKPNHLEAPAGYRSIFLCFNNFYSDFPYIKYCRYDALLHQSFLWQERSPCFAIINEVFFYMTKKRRKLKQKTSFQ